MHRPQYRGTPYTTILQTSTNNVQVWNREDSPLDPKRDREEYSRRLVPCWVFASPVPFGQAVGVAG